MRSPVHAAQFGRGGWRNVVEGGGMTVLSDIVSLLLPRLCPVCHRRLMHTERTVCAVCAAAFPRVMLDSVDDNVMLRTLWARVPVEHAFSLLSYRHHSPFHQLLMRIKYHGDVELAYRLGCWVGAEAVSAGLGGQVDLLVPVPLSKERLRQRGYNQAAVLAQGMGHAMGTAVAELLARQGHKVSQTHLSAGERYMNAHDIYRATVPEAYRGKRVALVDDVMTTGSTLAGCAEALLLADPTMQISVLTLAYAG